MAEELTPPAPSATLADHERAALAKLHAAVLTGLGATESTAAEIIAGHDTPQGFSQSDAYGVVLDVRQALLISTAAIEHLMHPEGRFGIGRVVMTPGTMKLCGDNPAVLAPYLERHRKADWGELDAEDRAVQNQSLADGSDRGERLMSQWKVEVKGGGFEKFWIITESDRSQTTILLPSEY